MSINDLFRKFAQQTSNLVGSPWAFMAAAGVIVLWAVTGPLFGFSDTWQLVINTGTTIVTFLMVFLIQNTQNRDAKSLHLKLDELLRGTRGARTGLVGLEDLNDAELEELQQEFVRIRDRKEGKTGEVSGRAADAVESVQQIKRKAARRQSRNRNGSH